MKPLILLSVFVISIYAKFSYAVEQEAPALTRPVIDPISSENIIQVVAGLLFVLFMVVAIGWAVRRVGGVRLSGGKGLNIICGMSMGARERVVLIQVGEEQVLIGVSPGRIQTLHVLENPIDLKADEQDKTSFSSKFAEVLKGKLQ